MTNQSDDAELRERITKARADFQRVFALYERDGNKHGAWWGRMVCMMDDVIGALNRVAQAPIVVTDEMSKIDGCEMTAGTLGGVLRLAGHRISIAQILAEIADSDAAKLFAANYDLDENEVTRAINGLLMWLSTVRRAALESALNHKEDSK